MLVDSHCHLEYDGLVDDQAAALDRAREAGIEAFLNISTKRAEWTQVVGTARSEDDVFASVGIHPHNADDHLDLTREELLEATRDPKVIGIGETGLDYYYEHSDRAAQQRLFRLHIDVAREVQLPVIIHTRDAEEDTLAILEDELGKGAFPALIHCFTASAEFGRQVLDLGLSVSISGIVTFKSARELQDFAREIPQDRLLIETDSPFLAPVPHRGKPCEPGFVRDTAQFIADLRSEPLGELARYTTQNFYTLFGKAAA
ncbi:TatD family hydrolase [Qipengyuania sp.]|uniref:TatD family hydrolase n=1 Tax=Qipengyuania sp. TaxID=2004515 RepID=UPI0035174FC0